ncbi:SGNH/GDSL hydrolase family protein [Microlunatus parietis]|uniref:Lysophospholipase L1-like esterase n=1 Tax=Microlunatus parietis TaxID=682979 RepID=A0A7Y9LAH1_9ACTN|nr:SGNH/GDSL hydrolase family protein [Microlunatus parietis]NYE68701.1 lysophospholipase L1-like esterase [Microlunatus parietis]
MGQRLVLVGDSVTDCGRDREDAGSLGSGWVSVVGAELPDVTVINRGISGNRVRDLVARWDADVLAAGPDTVGIMIGINDTWRRYDRDDPTSTEAFAAGYGELLDRTAAAGVARVILLEPVLTPIDDPQWAWREDLDPKISAVRRLAQRYGHELVPTDAVMNATAATRPLGELAPDGVHPSAAGHRVIAETFLQTYRDGSA